MVCKTGNDPGSALTAVLERCNGNPEFYFTA